MLEDQKSILIVDDNKELVDLLKIRLEHDGFRVQAATDGNKAVELVGRYKPDLLVLDIGMPRVDGFDVYKKLITQFGRSKLPVLIMTAHDEYRDTFNEMEVAGFISKPFELDQLTNEIERILNKTCEPDVFIVDATNPFHLQDIINELAKEQYRTRVVFGLPELKIAMDEHKPKCIFMEYMEPGIDGDTLIRETRKLLETFHRAEVPIIVYSYSGFNFQEKSLNAGASKYMGCPGSSEAFVRVIREYELKNTPE